MASVEAVAAENGSVIEALGDTGVAVYPADDEHAPLWHTLAGQRPQLTFALQGPADVGCRAAWTGDAWEVALHTPPADVALRLRMAGRHNLKNALAAATCALAAGAPLDAIVRGLESFEPVKGRSQLSTLTIGGRPVTLVDDTYNANPDSVRAAIDVLAALPAPQWLVLGDMGEVGSQGPQFHAEVGAYARERGLPALWCAGAQSEHAARAFGSAARHFADVPALIAALGAGLAQAPEAGAVLVKGSRFMQMERVVQALKAGAALQPSPPGAA
jgi:UDP-N-acetylmuramoyl-tripeptide--D-alanyl-D-alanine ligase